MSNTATVSYAWEEKGKQPRIECKQRGRERVTLFGAVDYNSGKIVAQSATKGNARSFKKYLKKVIKEFNGQKVIMVLDNVQYHHAKKVKKFLEINQDRLELVFLPAYSPDLNPMERVWWFMRKRITHNRACESIQERLAKFWRLFSRFQKPNEVISKLCNINFSV